MLLYGTKGGGDNTGFRSLLLPLPKVLASNQTWLPITRYFEINVATQGEEVKNKRRRLYEIYRRLLKDYARGSLGIRQSVILNFSRSWGLRFGDRNRDRVGFEKVTILRSFFFSGRRKKKMMESVDTNMFVFCLCQISFKWISIFVARWQECICVESCPVNLSRVNIVLKDASQEGRICH